MATVFARPKLQVFGISAAYVVRKIGLSDLGDALGLGWEDFNAIPTHAVVLCVIYPIIGIVLFRLVLGHSCCRRSFRWPPVLNSSRCKAVEVACGTGEATMNIGPLMQEVCDVEQRGLNRHRLLLNGEHHGEADGSGNWFARLHQGFEYGFDLFRRDYVRVLTMLLKRRESLRCKDRRLLLRAWDGSCSDEVIDLDFACVGRSGNQHHCKGEPSERFTQVANPSEFKIARHQDRIN